MSDANADARKQAIDYMVRLLQMNPVVEGDRIVRLRAQALRLKSATPLPTADQTEEFRNQRRQTLERLEQTRANFWTLPPAELKSALEKLVECPFPDIKLPVERLKVLASHRSEFPKLSQSPDFDGDMFRYLKQVFTDPPRDVAVLKEQVLSTFRNRQRRKRGRRMVKLIERELPAVYALEADWFKTLQRQKPPAREILVTGASRTPAGATTAMPWWLWLLIPLLSAVIRGLMRDR